MRANAIAETTNEFRVFGFNDDHRDDGTIERAIG